MGRSLDHAFQHARDGHVQALGQPRESADGNVYFATLDFAHVGAMDFTDIGKAFLRPTACGTQFPDPCSHNLL